MPLQWRMIKTVTSVACSNTPLDPIDRRNSTKFQTRKNQASSWTQKISAACCRTRAMLSRARMLCSPSYLRLPLCIGTTSPARSNGRKSGAVGVLDIQVRADHNNDKMHTRWYRARGRLGAPLRVSGVQDSCPPLTCSLNRHGSSTGICSNYRTGAQGKSLYSRLPSTRMWFLLYAQAAQIDEGVEKRNILVARAPARWAVAGKLSLIICFLSLMLMQGWICTGRNGKPP